MPIPKYDEITLPLLHLLADGREHHLRDLSLAIADAFQLTEEERNALLPSGKSNYVRNRTGWTAFHLKPSQASVAGGIDAGIDVEDYGRGAKIPLYESAEITRAELMQFEPFSAYIAQLRKKSDVDGAPTKAESKSEEETTPDERIEQADRELRASL